MSREHLFREIAQERDAQDVLWGGAAYDDGHSNAEWVAIICRHLGLSTDDAGGLTPNRYRRQLVRVAAIAVAALEAHDRKTGREVTAGEFQRGSGV